MIRSISVSLFFAISLSATVINVPADQATIQAGIDAAVDGDTVLVEAGLYYETIDFIGKNIVLLSSSGPSSTIIDGTTGGDTTSVVNMSSWGFSADCIIDGFTIQNGLVGISASPDYSNPTLTIHNCIITNTGTAISGHFLQSTVPVLRNQSASPRLHRQGYVFENPTGESVESAPYIK